MKRRFVPAVVLAAAATVAASAGEARSPWTFRQTLGAQSRVRIDDIDGTITARAAHGPDAVVRAVVTGRDAARVRVLERRSGTTLRHCVAFDDRARCDGGGGGGNAGPIEARVDFEATVPAGVAFSASDVNGRIVADVRSDVELSTVNEGITVVTDGTVRAHAVNGAIDATLGAGGGDTPLQFSTVNGSVHLTLPRRANATVDASTLSGGIAADRGVALVTHDGEYVGRSGTATYGSGGRRVSVRTVSGSIRLSAN